MGTYQNPTVTLINNCADDIVITDVVISAGKNAEIEASFTDIDGKTSYNSSFVFTRNGNDCSVPTVSGGHGNEHCKNILVPVQDKVGFLIPYDVSYAISGLVKSAQPQKLHVEGQMIENTSVESVLEMVRQNDNNGRLVLAKYYFYTKQKKDEAMALLYLAAKSGDNRAFAALSYCFQTTDLYCGVSRDPKRAYFYAIFALRGGLLVTLFYNEQTLRSTEKYLTPDEIADVKKDVAAWDNAHPAKPKR